MAEDELCAYSAHLKGEKQVCDSGGLPTVTSEQVFFHTGGINQSQPSMGILLFSVVFTSADKIPAFRFLQWNIASSILREKIFKFAFANEIGKIRLNFTR